MTPFNLNYFLIGLSPKIATLGVRVSHMNLAGVGGWGHTIQSIACSKLNVIIPNTRQRF